MQTPARPPVWLWLNLLSLDAPLIALVWQDFLARCYPTVLLTTGRVVLGLTVWAIYLADRLLDVREPASTHFESLRHRFYREHYRFARALLVAVLGLNVLITLIWLRPSVVDNGIVLTVWVLAYLAAFPITRWGATAWKKPLAAILFTAGTFLIAWTGTRNPTPRLMWPAAAFCALCLGNLMMIGHWSQAQSSRSVTVPRVWFCVLVAAAALAAAGGSHWFGAIVVSAGGLFALAHSGRRISSEARCVLADAVLLAPLLFHSVVHSVR